MKIKNQCQGSKVQGFIRILLGFVFLNLELLNRVYRRIDNQIVEVLVRHLYAVEQVNIMSAALTENGR